MLLLHTLTPHHFSLSLHFFICEQAAIQSPYDSHLIQTFANEDNFLPSIAPLALKVSLNST
jgi:hypothetical protein